MYPLFSFRRYSCFGSSYFLVPDRLRTKEDVHPSEGVKNYLKKKRKNRTIIETTNAIMHDHNLSIIQWAEACTTQYMFRTRVFIIL
jgi:hypothetical protein